MPQTFSRTLVPLWLALVAVSILAVPLHAQPAEGDRSGGVDLSDADPAARRLLADQLVLTALDLLATEGGAEVRADQMVRAHVLLELATQLVPRDAELWRLRAELEGRLNLGDARVDSLRAYVQLRPEDDAAQLDRVLAQLGRLPTLDDRLQTLDRLLSSRSARGLSKPLRSRLAVYAAAAANELGDQERYIDYVKQAASLDPANADAAAMVYDIAASRHLGPRRLGAAAVNLVRAAPLDPGPRLRLGGLLAEQGLYAEASTQFGVAQRLLGGPLPMEAYRMWVMAMAADGQDASADALLDDLLEAARERNAAEGDGPTAPLDLQVLRLALLDKRSQRETLESVYRRVRDVLLERAAAQGANPDAAGQAEASWEEQLGWVAPSRGERDNPKLEAAVLAAVFGFDLDRVGPWISEADGKDPRVALARGWLAHRQSFEAEAKRALEPLEHSEPLARLALAEMSGADEAGRARALREVVKSAPGSLAGLLAARRLLAMDRRLEPTDTGLAIRSYMRRWPPALWELDMITAPWATLRVDAERKEFDYLEPIELTATVQNKAPVPLAMSQAGPLGTLLVLQVEPSSAAGSLGQLSPVVVDMGRRLVLDEGASVSVPVRLNRSSLGTLIRRRPFASVSVAVTAMLDPRPAPDGRMTPGPLTTTETVQGLRASGEAVSAASVNSWLSSMRSRDPSLRMRNIARLIQLQPEAAAEVFNQALAAKIEDAIVAAGTSDDTMMQAWVLLLSPYSGQVARLDKVTQAAATSNVPLVRIAYLAAMRGEMDEDRLNDALRETDGLIQRYARAVKEARGTGGTGTP